MCLPYLLQGGDEMRSWEDAILERQESDAEDCSKCDYKWECKNQCMEIQKIYNPNLRRQRDERTEFTD